MGCSTAESTKVFVDAALASARGCFLFGVQIGVRPWTTTGMMRQRIVDPLRLFDSSSSANSIGKNAWLCASRLRKFPTPSVFSYNNGSATPVMLRRTIWVFYPRIVDICFLPELSTNTMDTSMDVKVTEVTLCNSGVCRAHKRQELKVATLHQRRLFH